MKGVSVYRNLNRPGVVWSVKSNRSGLVVARQGYVMIENAQLVVSQAGRRRVLRDRRKNVHAFVRGTWVRSAFDQHVRDFRTMTDGWVRLTYSPYKNHCFVVQTSGRPVTRAERVILDKDGAWALEAR
jgi:hypothetical protein